MKKKIGDLTLLSTLVVPIFKKGNVEDVQNISVLCAAYKVYAGILNERLKNDLIEKNRKYYVKLKLITVL